MTIQQHRMIALTGQCLVSSRPVSSLLPPDLPAKACTHLSCSSDLLPGTLVRLTAHHKEIRNFWISLSASHATSPDHLLSNAHSWTPGAHANSMFPQ
uniref:Uncharacterized protein n=1 Tax=Nothobranchius furzeri TaxID=105023 RepID=A0A8C6LCC9_NOTFU